ncbi:MAG: hypothetical protein U9N60_11975 [Thermodesulfobacteriota bacterium]|nr:hypothetical protein [Thermodesulfobacteriota bacterium]
MNPYKILGVDRSAGKREIVQAAAMALRERKFSGHEVALAQKQLLDPASKAVLDFLYFVESNQRRAETKPHQPGKRPDIADLKRLILFDANP